MGVSQVYVVLPQKGAEKFRNQLVSGVCFLRVQGMKIELGSCPRTGS